MWKRQGNAMRKSVDDVNWNDLLLYLGRNNREILHHVHSENNSVSKAIRINHEIILIRVSFIHNELVITFPQLNTVSDHVTEASATYVEEWFDLSRDLQPFYSLAEDDEILNGVVSAYKGLRIIGVEDLFEALCWSIMGQQISLHVAYALKQKLVTTYGESICHDGMTYWLFPSPERISSLSVEDLRALSFTQRKAEYVIGVAELMASDYLYKEQFIGLSLSEMEAKLIAIRGIGKWSANYVIMRCFRHPDAFPLADVGLHNALKKVRNESQKPSLEEIERWAENWRGWRAYATFYLWRTLQD
ncbi:DNA-3-methyladenine glycosylase [Paenisporosarcina quisquiliarum]|uniref:DNA-3-methyladenine glycosylase II n=2 Tax=Paenisporosarcina quisquiliarum TaxID=365346 RepID=A0A9X3LIE3_9BACL|nr:DNA-3-methyladenine glycosylase [Paenisporosarcina quisquiliarum]